MYVQNLHDRLLILFATSDVSGDNHPLPEFLLKRVDRFRKSLYTFENYFNQFVCIYDHKSAIVLRPNGNINLEVTVRNLERVMTKLNFLKLVIYSGVRIDKKAIFAAMSPEEQELFEAATWRDSLLMTVWMMLPGFPNYTYHIFDRRFIRDAIRACAKYGAASTMREILEQLPHFVDRARHTFFKKLPPSPNPEVRLLVRNFVSSLRK
ncbi:hypothetical protein QR680_014069 [Steinernema hermaphroditum]|uniref:Uncharacterized protein n=1 Tax=Steinernema hermaphroditum TaxID=289476 RepID=A0AA39M395_9BILA|nr:hypothetical protein QR680_014069 [Steinernema hermaphroditum]